MGTIEFVPATLPGNQWTKRTSLTIMVDYVPALLNGIRNINHIEFVPTAVGAVKYLTKQDIEYVPASTGIDKRSKYTHEGFKVSWWEKTSFYHHRSMLVSAFYGQDYPNFREAFNIPDWLWLLADSGGFQNITRKTDLTPENVLKWAEVNAQATLTLDYPLVTKISDLSTRYVLANQDEIERRLVKTAVDARVMHEKRTTNLELIFVTHGNTWADFDLALKKLKDEGMTLEDFDGESKSLKGDTPLIVAMKICHTLKNVPKGKRFHFLGLSGLHTTLVLFYAMTYRPDLVTTFDSSTYGSAGAIRREYWVHDQRYPIFFSSAEKIYAMKKLPCDCPVCNVVKTTDALIAPGSIAGGLIALHNLYIFLRYVNILNAIGEDREAIRDFATKFLGDKNIISVFDFIDYVMETDDVNGALRKFRNLVNWGKQESTIKKGSLDDIFGGKNNGNRPTPDSDKEE